MGGQRDAKFYSELKQTNEDLIGYLKACQEKSPYFDFTATLESYNKQVADLIKQFPEDQAAATTTTTTTANNNSSSNTSTTTMAAPSFQTPFSFGKPATTATTTSATPPAPQSSSSQSQLPPASTLPAMPTFGMSAAPTATTTSSLQPPTASLFSSAFTSTQPSSTFSSSFTTPAPALSFMGAPIASSSAPDTTTTTNTTTTAPATTSTPFLFGSSAGTSMSSTFSFVPPPIPKPADISGSSNLGGQQEATNDGDDEPHQPPEPKIDKYEEPDAKLALKCKLYERSKNTELNYIATGTFFVKSMETPDKLQIIIRQEPDLRRVLLNEVVTTSIPVRILPKAVQIAFIDNSGETKFYIAKVKDEAEAKTLYETLKFIRN